MHPSTDSPVHPIAYHISNNREDRVMERTERRQKAIENSDSEFLKLLVEKYGEPLEARRQEGFDKRQEIFENGLPSPVVES